MSRRLIAKSFRLLKNELMNDVETIILREMGRLEAVSSTPTCTSSATPSSSQALEPMPASAPTTTTETNEEKASDQGGVVIIPQELGRTLYRLVENV
jgi:hypothetical protein